MAVYIAEGELLILPEIVGNYKGTEIVDPDECSEVHAGVGHAVLLKMLH